MNTDTMPTDRSRSVGWPELAVAAITAVVLYIGGGLGLYLLELPAAASGVAQFALSAAVPVLAFVAAVLTRRRSLSAFGFRRVAPRWLLLAALLGLVAMGLASLLSIFVLDPLFPDDNTQADYDTAATAGIAFFLGTLAMGGVIEPFGEELLFRGVLASFLKRWGPWVMIIGSTLVFALAHGINVVFFSAVFMSVVSTYLYWRTGSIWTSVIVHITYNSGALIAKGLGL